MDLILKVVEGPSSGDWHGIEARFDASGGLIGRAETARLSLPDASRTVSRFHAHISCSGDTYFLEEMGSRNASSINGKALKAGSKEPLRPGDRVRIGHFTLAVDFDDPDFPATQVMDRRSLQIALGQDEDSDSTRVAVRGATGSRGAPDTGLLDAFQEGAGVQLELPVGLHPGFMRLVGQLLRTLVTGVQHLNSQRMRLRDEPSDQKAQARARHIDPIRAAAEGARLMSALFKPGAFGSDKPETRVQEMIDDLTARISALRAAVDVAVEQAEARLSPAAVEARLGGSLFLDELLPIRRKARLWDLYRRMHGASAAAPTGNGTGNGTANRTDGASDAAAGARAGRALGVRELFNQAFTRAYETEMARLRRGRE